MVGLNKLMVIGNVGTTPEMQYTPNGNPVTKFRLAVGRSYTDSSGERHQETEWLTVIAWGKQAESCNTYLEKGKRVYAEGRLQSKSWTGQDGQPRFNNELVASRVLFLDRSPNGSGEGPATGEGEESPATNNGEELPW